MKHLNDRFRRPSRAIPYVPPDRPPELETISSGVIDMVNDNHSPTSSDISTEAELLINYEPPNVSILEKSKFDALTLTVGQGASLASSVLIGSKIVNLWNYGSASWIQVLNRTRQHSKWFFLGEPFNVARLIVLKNKVLVLHDGGIVFFNVSNGAITNSIPLPGVVAVDKFKIYQNYLCCVVDNTGVFCACLEEEELKWIHNFSAGVLSGPGVYPGNDAPNYVRKNYLYTVSENSHFLSYELETGKLFFNKGFMDAAGKPHPVLVDQVFFGGFLTVATSKNIIFQVNESGTVVRQHSLGEFPAILLIPNGENLIVILSSGAIILLDENLNGAPTSLALNDGAKVSSRLNNGYLIESNSSHTSLICLQNGDTSLLFSTSKKGRCFDARLTASSHSEILSTDYTLAGDFVRFLIEKNSLPCNIATINS